MTVILSALTTALAALARNKLRAVLTLLGILIGTAAFVIVWALGSGASSFIGGKVSDLGSNILYVFPQPVQASGARSKVSGRLTENDGKAIARDAVSVAGVAAFLSTMSQVVAGDKNVQTSVYGVNLPYFWIRKFEIDQGDFWTETDQLVKTKVCVLGPTVAHNLFGDQDPVGRVVRVGRAPYRVLGVTKARGTSLFGEDQDDRIFMPIGSFRARVMPTSPGRVDMLMAASTSEDTTNRASRADRVDLAPASPHPSGSGQRLQGERAGRPARGAEEDHRSALVAAHRRRRGEPRRRRHRRHEHHARERRRANARDRDTSIHRRARERHPRAVPRRGGRA